MEQQSPSTPYVRVLAFVLHGGSSGRVVIDGFGVLPGSFRTSRHLDPGKENRDPSILSRLLERTLRRYKPSHVVLGVPPRENKVSRRLRRLARRLLHRYGVSVVVRRVMTACELVCRSRLWKDRNELGERLVRGFFPELRTQLGCRPRDVWYFRPAWHAASLALHEYMKHAPVRAIALARPEAFTMGTFAQRIQQHMKRLSLPSYEPHTTNALH